MTDEGDDTGGSPACFAHLLIDGQPVDEQTRRDVAVFRKAERTRLYAARAKAPPDERSAMAGRIAQRLDEVLGEVSGR
ncbi:hypothetical protein LL06_06670, partial [Hoeflea sp. BAL378]